MTKSLKSTTQRKLARAFAKVTSAHIKEGGRIPTTKECLELAAGDLFHFNSDGLPVALYYAMSNYLEHSETKEWKTWVYQLIRFLDVLQYGDQLDSLRRALDDDDLPWYSITDPGIIKQADERDPNWRNDIDGERQEVISEAMSRITSAQARAIHSWLMYVASEPTVRMESKLDIEGALAYWERRAN